MSVSSIAGLKHELDLCFALPTNSFTQQLLLLYESLAGLDCEACMGVADVL